MRSDTWDLFAAGLVAGALTSCVCHTWVHLTVRLGRQRCGRRQLILDFGP